MYILWCVHLAFSTINDYCYYYYCSYWIEVLCWNSSSFLLLFPISYLTVSFIVNASRPIVVKVLRFTGCRPYRMMLFRIFFAEQAVLLRLPSFIFVRIISDVVVIVSRLIDNTNDRSGFWTFISLYQLSRWLCYRRVANHNNESNYK